VEALLWRERTGAGSILALEDSSGSFLCESGKVAVNSSFKTEICFPQALFPSDQEDRMGVRARKRQKRLAEKLRRIRESLGLTQKELLKLFKIDWLHQSNNSSYELGATEPPLYVIEKYAEVANVCMDVLISDKHSLPEKLPVKTLYHPHKG
jgi:hypothetical protein